jgi:hypothetical protein
MRLVHGHFYHITNHGNCGNTLFFRSSNYHLFVEKLRRYIKPRCELISWCLVPKRFDLLVYATQASTPIIPQRVLPLQAFSNGLQLLLSSYARCINLQERRKGNLFQQKTRSSEIENNVKLIMRQIHSRPLDDGLVSNLNEWPYSSFNEYRGIQNLCDCRKALEILAERDLT